MDEPLNIKLNEFVIEIEGVKIAIASLKHMMENPPSQSLFNFKRVGDTMEIRRFDSRHAAAQFFEVWAGLKTKNYFTVGVIFRTEANRVRKIPR